MKVKVIILGTGNATCEFITRNQKSEYIEIIGVITDASVEEADRREFIDKTNKSLSKPIEVFEMTEEYLNKADLIFSPEYRKIIPKELCEKYVFVNCHAGILPKWRGFSANAWAIMNGEKEVGFSIHRIRPGVDDGEVFYVKHIQIQEEQTYADVHEHMIDAIVADVPKVLNDVFFERVVPMEQPKCGFAYCNRFTRSMGNISDFRNTTQYYVNLYRCMSAPLGTGLWFVYKGVYYAVKRIEDGKKYGVIDYIGVPGKVVNIQDNKLWVKTQDNVVVLSGLEVDGKIINVTETFRNGSLIM